MTAASFIVDQNPIFAYMGWNLAQSLVLAGNFRWSDIHIQFTEEVPERIVELFKQLGCLTYRLGRFGDGKYCNKLAQWQNLRGIQADHIVFLDTDMVCISPFIDYLPKDAIAGKIVDLANPECEILDIVFSQAGFEDRPRKVMVDGSMDLTYFANCNGGFYYVPIEHADELFNHWKRFATLLLDKIEPLRQAGKQAHVDQISFCMAVHRSGLPFYHLPSNLNYYVHFRGPHNWKDAHLPLAMLHYHNTGLGSDGLIKSVGASEDDERWAISRANQRIAENFNGDLFRELLQHRSDEQRAILMKT